MTFVVFVLGTCSKMNFFADMKVFKFHIKLLMLTHSTVQKHTVLNSNSAFSKEKNFSPQTSLPAFFSSPIQR